MAQEASPALARSPIGRDYSSINREKTARAHGGHGELDPPIGRCRSRADHRPIEEIRGGLNAERSHGAAFSDNLKPAVAERLDRDQVGRPNRATGEIGIHY